LALCFLEKTKSEKGEDMKKQKNIFLFWWPVLTAGFVALYWADYYLVFGRVPVVTGIPISPEWKLELPFSISRWWDIALGVFWPPIISFLFDHYKKEKDLDLVLVMGLMVGLGSGLVVNLGVGLVFCLLIIIIFGLLFSSSPSPAIGLIFGLSVSLGAGLTAGIAAGIISGLAAVLVFGLGILAKLAFNLCLGRILRGKVKGWM
jgi:hypothetical protein